MSNERKLVRLSEVQPQPQEWLWQDYVPIGAITDLFGDPGQAKTRLTYDLTVRVTTGQPMPLCKAGAPPAGVVLLQIEDSLKSTVRTTLSAAGADINRVVVYNSAEFKGRPLTLPDDMALLKDAVDEVKAKLLVIDPASVFFSCNPNSDKSVRQALMPLVTLAERDRLAVLVLRHPNKSNWANLLYQGAGSIGWVATARSAWTVMSDPTSNSPYDHLLVQTKTNLSSAPTLGYRTVLVDGHIFVEWLGQRSLSAQDLSPGQSEDVSKLREAMEVLFLILRGGPRGSKDAYKRAAEEGIARKTLERAKAALGVTSGRHQFTTWSWCWEWRLPVEENEVLASVRQKYEALDASLSPSTTTPSPSGPVD